MPDYSKRQKPKNRLVKAGLAAIPEPVKEVGRDIAAGYGELKRQSGAAVENIKGGIRKIKEAVKR